MKRAPTHQNAWAIFERKLLAADRAGVPCNLRDIAGAGGCTHDRKWCWIESWVLLSKALKYGRRRGLISIPDPWRDRSWMKKEPRKP